MKDQAEEKVRTRFPTQPRIGAFHRSELHNMIAWSLLESELDHSRVCST